MYSRYLQSIRPNNCASQFAEAILKHQDEELILYQNRDFRHNRGLVYSKSSLFWYFNRGFRRDIKFLMSLNFKVHNWTFEQDITRVVCRPWSFPRHKRGDEIVSIIYVHALEVITFTQNRLMLARWYKHFSNACQVSCIWTENDDKCIKDGMFQQ